MEKISLDELRSILKELGHTDEEVEEVISKKEKEETPETDEEEKTEVEIEVDATPEEDSVAEGEGESAPVEEPKPVESESPEGEEPSDVAPVEEEVAPVEPSPVEEESPVEESGEPVPPADESALPEGVEEVDPTEPMPEEVAPAPAEPSVDIQAILSDLEEYKKANAGLQARVDALESALKEAGVLGESSLPSHSVGVDDGSRVPNYHDDDAAFEDVISELNRGY